MTGGTRRLTSHPTIINIRERLLRHFRDPRKQKNTYEEDRKLKVKKKEWEEAEKIDRT